jgi:PEGA domain
MARIYRARLVNCVLVLCALAWLPRTSYAGNQILGELQLKGATGVEKDSGVWVDGQYLGYLKELKGSKKVLLLPGEHEVLVRQAGYHDFTQKVTVVPGEKETIRVRMQKDPSVHYPDRKTTAEIQLEVAPDRAAVFVDGLLIGHVAEFQGAHRALLVAPGKRKITISLPGYQTFETEVNLAPRQKFKLRTSLMWNGATEDTASR